MTRTPFPIAAALAVALTLPLGACADGALTGPDYEGATAVPEALSGGIVHRVSAGTADLCEDTGQPTGCDANFSLIAMERADGTIHGRHTDLVRQGDQPYLIAGDVDCLRVEGNAAVIGGVLTHGPDAGTRFLTAVRDNGRTPNEPRDEISYTYPNIGLTCADVAPGQFPYFELGRGQVSVQ